MESAEGLHGKGSSSLHRLLSSRTSDFGFKGDLGTLSSTQNWLWHPCHCSPSSFLRLYSVLFSESAWELCDALEGQH